MKNFNSNGAAYGRPLTRRGSHLNLSPSGPRRRGPRRENPHTAKRLPASRLRGAARPLRLRPRPGRTRVAGRRAATLTTRARKEGQRLRRAPSSPARANFAGRSDVCPGRTCSAPSLPGRPLQRSARTPGPRPREPTTRFGRFPAPRATSCPPSNVHGRPHVRLPDTFTRRQWSLRPVGFPLCPAATYLPTRTAVAVAFTP